MYVISSTYLGYFYNIIIIFEVLVFLYFFVSHKAIAGVEIPLLGYFFELAVFVLIISIKCHIQIESLKHHSVTYFNQLNLCRSRIERERFDADVKCVL